MITTVIIMITTIALVRIMVLMTTITKMGNELYRESLL